MLSYPVPRGKAQERIYNALLEYPQYPGIINRELSLLTDMSPRNVTRTLLILEKKGKIKIVRPSRIRRFVYVL